MQNLKFIYFFYLEFDIEIDEIIFIRDISIILRYTVLYYAYMIILIVR